MNVVTKKTKQSKGSTKEKMVKERAHVETLGEAASELVKGNPAQAITAYSEALGDTSLPNDRRATILTDRAVAYARTARIDYKFNIYAAGANQIAFYLTGGVELPPFPGKISGSKLTVTIPDEVQQPLAGLYSTVESINAKLGTKAYKKGRGKKLLMRYDGPFEIARKLSPITYQLRLPVSYGIHPIINIAHLQPYQTSPPEFGERPKRAMNRDDFDARPEVEIERILAERWRKRGKRRIQQFQVRWKGFDADHDEWLPKHALRNAQAVLQEWPDTKVNVVIRVVVAVLV